MSSQRLYFAYGSNNLAQMKERLSHRKDGTVIDGEIEIAGSYQLKGYKLSLNKWSVNRKAFVGNIVETTEPNDVVFGLLFSLNQQQMLRLHEFEGVNPDGSQKQSGYGYCVQILDLNEEEQIFLYQSPVTDDTKYSTVDYLNNFVEAFLNNGYPKEYIKNILTHAVVDHKVCRNKKSDLYNPNRIVTIDYINHRNVSRQELAELGYSEQESSTVLSSIEKKNLLIQRCVAEGIISENDINMQSVEESLRPIPSEGIWQQVCSFFSFNHFRSTQNQLEQKVKEGKQISVLQLLTSSNTCLSEVILNDISHDEYRLQHPKTFHALIDISEAYSTLKNNSNFDFRGDTQLAQEKLIDCISRGAQKGALMCLAKGASINEDVIERYNMIAHKKNTDGKYVHPKLLKSFEPYIVAYKSKVDSFQLDILKEITSLKEDAIQQVVSRSQVGV